MAKEKLLSVIVPVHNGGRYLEKSLPAIFNSDYPNFEVIVVNDASTDNTIQVAKRFPCSLINIEKNQGPANARNVGAEKAKGEILVYFDADIVIERNTLSKFAAAHANPRIKVCQTQVSPNSINKGFSQNVLATIWNYQLDIMETNPTFLSTMSCSIDKKVFEEVGGFNTQFKYAGGEEFEMGKVLKQHGYDIYLDQSIVVHHHFPGFFKRCKILFKRSAIYSDLILRKQINSNKGNGTASQAVNALLACASLATLIGSFFFTPLLAIFAVFIGSQLAIDGNMYAHIAKKRNTLFSIASIPSTLAWNLIMGLAIIKSGTSVALKKVTNTFTWASFFLSKTPPYIIFFVNAICNARCKHCFINWDDIAKQRIPALSLEEIKKVSKSFGKVSYLTLTGGEPTLRPDIAEIAQTFYENNNLEILNLITNGFSTDKLYKDVKKILRYCPNLNVQVHFSIDAIGKLHDEIRVVPGGFNRLLQSIEKVRALKQHYPNLYMGIITTYSKFNKDNIYEVINYVVDDLKLPMYLNYVRGQTYDRSAREVDIRKYGEASRIVQIKNAELSKRTIPRPIDVLNNITPKIIDAVAKEDKFVVPCRVGTKLIEIGHDGTIFPCEILDDKFGNIKDYDYSIKKILATKTATDFSKRIIKTKCKCTWECAIKNNILYTPSQYPNIATEWFKLLLKTKQKEKYVIPYQEAPQQLVQIQAPRSKSSQE
jgi:glycosyltransferase involved in cell wall biosynthesis